MRATSKNNHQIEYDRNYITLFHKIY